MIARCLAREPVDRFSRPKDAVLALSSEVSSPERSIPGLPSASTPFVGRTAELHALEQLLRDPSVRLVTISGPGGAGKTRLALEAMTRLSGELRRETTFVNLAPLTEPAAVLRAIALALGLQPNREEAVLHDIATELRSRPRLLLLDNFEQVIGAAPDIALLLRAVPDTKALVTSRTLLRIAGEHDLPVSGLSLDPAADASSEAVQLFLGRARALVPTLAVDSTRLAEIAGICARLDGLPLAIELAASRVRLLDPADLLQRLQQAGGPLRILTRGDRDSEPRQRTLRSTLAWSDALLQSPERRLLHRLGVFAHAFTLEAAASVAATDETETLEQLAALVDSSLVIRLEQEGTRTRFSMLQTVREYARDALETAQELAQSRERHARHFLGDAERRAPELTGPAQLRHFDELEADHDELLLALDWFQHQGAWSEMLRLAVALGHFWEIRGHWLEGLQMLERALEGRRDLPPLLVARGLHWRGVLAWSLGDLRLSRALHEESVALFRTSPDVERLMDGLLALYWTVMFQGDLAAGAALNDEALALARRVGDRRLRALALVNRSWLACEQGDLVEGERLNEEAIAELRTYRDQSTLVRHINCRGEIAALRGEWQRAEDACAEALQLARVTRYPRQIAVSGSALAFVKLQLGDLQTAKALLRESATVARELGDRKRQPIQLLGLAYLHGRSGDTGRAALLLGGARALLHAQGIVLTMADKELAEELERMLDVLPEAERQALEETGARRHPDELVALGLEDR